MICTLGSISESAHQQTQSVAKAARGWGSRAGGSGRQDAWSPRSNPLSAQAGEISVTCGSVRTHTSFFSFQYNWSLSAKCYFEIYCSLPRASLHCRPIRRHFSWLNLMLFSPWGIMKASSVSQSSSHHGQIGLIWKITLGDFFCIVQTIHEKTLETAWEWVSLDTVSQMASSPLQSDPSTHFWVPLLLTDFKLFLEF